MSLNLPEPEPVLLSPSRDRTDRHATDAYLRRHGFRIYSRPRRLEPVWERAGRLYKQSDALALTLLADTPARGTR